MSYCYHPLKGLDLGLIPETGKHNIKILKGEYSADEVCNVPGAKFIPLPCGRCIGCRLKYSRDWADRCMLESLDHEHNWFLTLTYDDDHLPTPLVSVVDKYDNDGEFIGTELKKSPIHPLRKRDFQLFIKRLRRNFPDANIRYFGCGEYGPKSARPHYHILLFGLKLDDLVIHHRDIRTGNVYYISDSIRRCWYPESDSDLPTEQRSVNGFHLLTSVSWDTCAYVARYVMKKQKGATSSIYEDYNFPPEFTLMSRKPGIGRNFYEKHKDIVTKPYYIPSKDGHKVIRSNRYFDKCFDIDYPDELESIKQERVRIAQANEDLKSNLTSLNYRERLAAEELNKIDSTKILSRKEV